MPWQSPKIMGRLNCGIWLIWHFFLGILHNITWYYLVLIDIWWGYAHIEAETFKTPKSDETSFIQDHTSISLSNASLNIKLYAPMFEAGIPWCLISSKSLMASQPPLGMLQENWRKNSNSLWNHVEFGCRKEYPPAAAPQISAPDHWDAGHEQKDCLQNRYEEWATRKLGHCAIVASRLK